MDTSSPQNGCWSDLPLELLEKIVSCLENSYLHVLRFRAVCRSWRSSTPLPPRIPSLMLPPLDVESEPILIKELAVYFVQQAVSGTGSTPLLLRAHETSDVMILEELFNPLPLEERNRRTELDLIDFRVRELWFDYSLQSDDGCVVAFTDSVAVNSSFRKTDCGRFTAVAWIYNRSVFAMWRMEADMWTTTTYSALPPLRSFVYCNDKLYAHDYFTGPVVAISATKPDCIELRPVAQAKLDTVRPYNLFLVESFGDLYLVTEYYSEPYFVVEKLDDEEEGGEWVKPGDEWKERLLFLSSSSSFSLMAKDFPEYKANCIYLPGIYNFYGTGPSGIGVFDMEDGTAMWWCDYYDCPEPPIWLHRYFQQPHQNEEFIHQRE
ncbi:hypothetical protein Tsubulata_033854 [Turnera subulata]|uniref:F-box domain-containing protein n=1 Tax=Turnera subulata TaxID=218843 RepID=A0A9Q0J2U7_9ROSI|nr:hypothetical protein Tsubulata_033854 [Turnera subulata]